MKSIGIFIYWRAYILTDHIHKRTTVGDSGLQLRAPSDSDF
jgi:hypothetical protein